MLKCGQKDNENYTFGVRKEQMEKEAQEKNKICCGSCGACLTKTSKFCSSCGEKI